MTTTPWLKGAGPRDFMDLPYTENHVKRTTSDESKVEAVDSFSHCSKRSRLVSPPSLSQEVL